MSQFSTNDSRVSKTNLPVCFLIGEYEQAYDGLLEQYSKSLVSVCNDNNEKAFDLWSGVLYDIAEYGKNSDFDLNGLKIWINVFFNSTGNIDHIVYYPKPNSKNMDFNKLTSFFTSFCNSYKMKVILKEKCLLNATASFPLYIKK